MEFRIADTFTDSLAKLTGDEQKAAKTTAFDLQVNPANPGLQFHKLDRSRDARFSSVRVSRDIRAIVHRMPGALLLCYVGHHDAAYAWAERRKLEVHPTTGAAQLVEVRETIEEISVPRYVDVARPHTPKPALFASLVDDQLLAFGVPSEWLAEVKLADEDTVLDLVDHLPAEAAEALLELATGGSPAPAPRLAPAADPFEHPDAQRRFRVMRNAEELELALAFPWDKWTVYLHPEQRTLIQRDNTGPARIAGSAGTGKSVVAVHRAVYLARTNPDTRVLVTTFSDPLAHLLRMMVRRLVGSDPRLAERIEVQSMDAIGLRLYQRLLGPVKLASAEIIGEVLRAASVGLVGSVFSERFIRDEWDQVVDAWQVDSWEAYRDVPRLGRKTRLPEKSRAALWSIFEKALAALRERGVITSADMFSALAAKIAASPHPPFDYAIVDECQDVNVSQLRFLAALGNRRPDALFFTGDLGQRIFQTPFSWKALGVDVRGRSSTLRVNYRTSHQIRTMADRLLGSEVADVDGITETRRGTVSTFNGRPPIVVLAANEKEEAQVAAAWLADRLAEGVVAGEIGVFVRSPAQMQRAESTLAAAGVSYTILDERLATNSATASLCTMHLAKGLEFRTVLMLACDEDVLPLRARLDATGDEADLEQVYTSERNLLYVACTRARDHLLLSGLRPGSEFLDDLGPSAT